MMRKMWTLTRSLRRLTRAAPLRVAFPRLALPALAAGAGAAGCVAYTGASAVADTKEDEVVTTVPECFDCLGSYIKYHEEISAQYPNIDILPLNSQALALHTIIRDKGTSRDDFVFYSNRIIRLLIEQALSKLPFVPTVVMTPCDVPFYGFEFRERVVGVSIMRAGDSMVAGLRSVAKGVRIGKILIQRDEDDLEKKAHMSYKKLPGDISRRHVLLLDPMLATGGSACLAIDALIKAGVSEERITFVNVVANPEGIERLFREHPKITIVTSFVDPGMNEMKYILPGLGDFGDRYFGTEEDQHGRRTYTYH